MIKFCKFPFSSIVFFDFFQWRVEESRCFSNIYLYKSQIKVFKKIASNTISQIFSKASTAFISIFLLSILTNYLSVELFWLYNKLYNYLSLFAFLADMGLYTIAIREISKTPSKKGKIIGNIMSLRAVLWIAIFFLALGIAFFLPGYNSSLALLGVTIISIFTLFSLLNSSFLALMQASMKIEFNVLSTTFGKLCNLACIALIAFIFFPKNTLVSFDLPFLLILVAGFLWILVNTVMNFWYARKLSYFCFEWDKEYIKHIIKISLPYGIALFLSVVYFKIDIILLSLLEPENIRDTSIALYSLPMKIVEVLMTLGMFYLNSILPSLSEYFHQKEIKKAEKLLSTSFKILLSLGLLFFVLWVLFREQIIHLIATPLYLEPSLRFDSADAMLVVLWVVVFYFISNLFNYILIASDHQSLLLRINIIITVVNIIWNLIFIPYYSFIGSGIVTIISQILLFWLWLYFSRWIIRFRFDPVFIVGLFIFSILVYIIASSLVNIFHFSDIFEIILIWSFVSAAYFSFLYMTLKKKLFFSYFDNTI